MQQGLGVLGTYRPRRCLGYANVREFFASAMLQGLCRKQRRGDWKFVLSAATRYRWSCGTAMTLAVMERRFQMMTGEHSKADG